MIEHLRSRCTRLPDLLLRFAAALVAACALAACTLLGPSFERPAVEAPADWAAWHGGAAALADSQTRAGVAHTDLTDWWTRWQDPVLDDLQARARRANAELQAAALRLAQSRVERAMVAAQRGPDVNAGAAASRQRQSETGAGTRLVDAIATPANRPALIGILSEPFSLYQAGFDASWELDLWGRVRRAVEAADAGIAASAAILRDVQASILAEVARNYVELRASQHQLRIARAQVAAAEESLELIQALADGAVATDLDVTRQRALAADVRARVPVLLEQEARASNRITLLVGERPGALAAQLADRGDAADTRPLPDLRLGLPSELARRRPDIAAAEARLHAATARIGVAAADLYPRITLGAAFGLESLHGSRFGDWGNHVWSIGPSLTLPIFDQGRRQASVTLTELQQQEAAVHYQQTVLNAWHEIDSALSAYAAQHQRHEQLADKLRNAEEALVLARARYRGGLTDLLPELDAQRTALAAEHELAESSSRLALQAVAIYKALGAGSEP